MVFSVLMAIIANDFTLSYFNFSLGLPVILSSDSSPMISTIDDEFTNEMKNEITDDNDQWMTTATWD